jgi:hypothetical protein
MLQAPEVMERGGEHFSRQDSRVFCSYAKGRAILLRKDDRKQNKTNKLIHK